MFLNELILINTPNPAPNAIIIKSNSFMTELKLIATDTDPIAKNIKIKVANNSPISIFRYFLYIDSFFDVINDYLIKDYMMLVKRSLIF